MTSTTTMPTKSVASRPPVAPPTPFVPAAPDAKLTVRPSSEGPRATGAVKDATTGAAAKDAALGAARIATTTHVVQAGDSYWRIAEQHPVPGVSTPARVQELVALNAPRLTGTPDDTMLHPGDEVYVPTSSAPAALPAVPAAVDPVPTSTEGAAAAPEVAPMAPIGGTDADPRRQSIVDSVLDKLGTPYVFGASGPDAYDCSGLTRAVLLEHGIDVPHKALWQSQQGPHIGRDELQPGDLVFFQNSEQSDIGHVGVYIGDGQFVHAPNSGSVVRVDNLDSDYYQGTFQFGVSLDDL